MSKTNTYHLTAYEDSPYIDMRNHAPSPFIRMHEGPGTPPNFIVRELKEHSSYLLIDLMGVEREFTPLEAPPHQTATETLEAVAQAGLRCWILPSFAECEAVARRFLWAEPEPAQEPAPVPEKAEKKTTKKKPKRLRKDD